MRWAVFKDFRGVLYCEPANEGIRCWTKTIPARPKIRHIIGRPKPARPAQVILHTEFLESHYSRDDYVESAFEMPPQGFQFDNNMTYLKENRWGAVRVLKWIEDDNKGRRLQYQLRKLAPDQSMWVEERDNDAAPHPLTQRILVKLLMRK